MPSSISSSEPGALEDSPVVPAQTPARPRPWLPFAATAILLSLYQLGVTLSLVPRAEGLGEMSANRIVVERCLYRGDSSADLVLAGSSCTQALRAEFLGGDIVNLGMSRQSSATGVELVRALSLKPRVLVVEVGDVLWLGENREMIDDMLQPHRRWLHAHLPILRDEYRPINVFAGALRNWHQSRQESGEVESVRVNAAYTKLMIQKGIDGRATPLTRDQEVSLLREARSLKEKIDSLQSGSVRVVLHRIPRDPQIDSTLQQRQILAIMESVFPADRYEWVPLPPPGPWETRDGYHMTRHAAAGYARYLNRYLQRTSTAQARR